MSNSRKVGRLDSAASGAAAMLGSAQIVELAEARIGALERGVALHGIADAEVAEDDEDAAAGEPRLVIGLVDPSLHAGRVVLDLAAVLGRPP